MIPRKSEGEVRSPIQWVREINRVGFLGLMAVFAIRPLIPELFERLDLSFIPQDVGGPTPVTTAVLDFLTLALALVAWLLPGPARSKPNPVLTGMLLLALAVVISTVAADDRRLAALAGGSLLAVVFGATGLYRAMREPWMPRILLAALLAGGTLNAVKCLSQSRYEFQATQEYWEETIRPRLVAQGRDVESAAIVNYERRLRSGNAYGYQSHPNVVGSMLAMCGVMGLAACVAAGLELRLNRRRIEGTRAPESTRHLAVYLFLSAIAVILLPAWALPTTGSRGALAAAGTGIGLIWLMYAIGRRSARPERTATWVFWGGLAAAAIGLVGLGATTGTLPGASLAFRWEYWSAAAHAWLDAPLTGLGRENFVDAYMRYRAESATEEVRNPHNLYLSLLVELGPIGLAGGLLLMVCAMRRLAPTTGEARPSGERRTFRFQPAMASMAAFLSAFALLSATPLHLPGQGFIWIVEFALLWSIAFLAIAAMLIRIPAGSTILAAGGFAACGTGLVHGLVDFAMLTPAGLCLWLGIATAMMRMDPAAPARAIPAPAPGREPGIGGAAPARRDWLVAAAGAGLQLKYAMVNLVPVAVAQNHLDEMMRGVATARSFADLTAADARGMAAIAADSLDPQTPRRVASLERDLATPIVELQVSQPPPHDPGDPREQQIDFWLARAATHSAIALARNPNSVATLRLVREIRRIEHQRCLNPPRPCAGESLDAAVSAAEAVTERFPSSAGDHVAAGWLRWQRWNTNRSARAEDRERAARHFRRAIDLDDLRPTDNATRLNRALRESVRGALHELASDSGSSASSGPAKTPEQP